jgi:hypothetical protein
MDDRRARVLVVDDADGNLSSRLAEGLARHDVEFARDALDAIRRIDLPGGRPHDIIFCDLASNDRPGAGAGLWAYLALLRPPAAERVVFVASTPLPSETAAFVQCVPNQCVDLPVDAEALDALANRRAGGKGPALARCEPRRECASADPEVAESSRAR